MGQPQRKVFVLESPGVAELCNGTAEAPLVAKLLDLLEVPHLSIQARSMVELELAARLFKRDTFATVLLSAHGAKSGLELSDGTLVLWKQLFEMFNFQQSQSLILSACSAFGDPLLEALDNLGSSGPHQVLGYPSPVLWSDSALASLLLIRGSMILDVDLAMRSMYAVKVGMDLDLWGYVYWKNTGKYRRFSIRDWLESEAHAARKGKENLLTQCAEIEPLGAGSDGPEAEESNHVQAK